MQVNKYKDQFDKQVKILEEEEKILRKFERIDNDEQAGKSEGSDNEKKYDNEQGEKVKKSDEKDKEGKSGSKGQPGMVNIEEICKLIDRKIKKLDRKLKETDLKLIIRLHRDQNLGP